MLSSPQHVLTVVVPGGFIKTIIRVLRCVGHFNSKLLVDKVTAVLAAGHMCSAQPGRLLWCFVPC